eukprot:gene8165-9037_t
MEDNNENLTFRESDHPLSLAKELNDLRKNGRFCDVKIIVGSKSFKAHRCVLSSGCSYFRTMFSSGLRESEKDEIEIFEIDDEIFDMLLTFIYTGSVIVDMEKIQHLFVAANMLQLSSLKNVCSSYLQNKIDTSNCIGLYKFAEAYDCEELHKRTKLFLATNFIEIFQIDNEEFLELDCKTLSQILSNENLKIESEQQILLAALRWLMNKTEFSSTEASSILNKIRFPLLTELDIENCLVRAQSDFKEQLNRKCKEYTRIEKMCKNYRTLQISVQFNTSKRKGAMKFLYIIGGYQSPKGLLWYSGRCLSSTEKFDFETGRSKGYVPLMQEEKRSHVAAVVQGNIIVFGGECDSLLSDLVEKYDCNSNKWTRIGLMNNPRCGFGIAVVENHIFLIGGCIGSRLTKDVDKYDIETNKMEKVGELTNEKAYFGCAVYGGNVYISGGIDKYDDYLSSTEMFDPFPIGYKPSNIIASDDNNSNLLPIAATALAKMATSRANHSLVTLNNYLYSIGGQSNPKYTLRLVDRYSPLSDVWETVSLLPDPRSHLTAVAYKDKIYVVGGRDQNANTMKSIIYFIPSSVQWGIELFSIETDRCDAVGVIL